MLLGVQLGGTLHDRAAPVAGRRDEIFPRIRRHDRREIDPRSRREIDRGHDDAVARDRDGEMDRLDRCACSLARGEREHDERQLAQNGVTIDQCPTALVVVISEIPPAVPVPVSLSASIDRAVLEPR